jgi:hypothetical protein
MTDGGTTEGGAVLQPGAGGAPTPFLSRSAYAGHKEFGASDGAVLIEPRVARELQRAAQSATQEGRIAGGLLYGRRWSDEQGSYLVINGFLEAGPGENRGDQIPRAGRDEFTLSASDLRLLRRDAGRMYPSSAEAGWWRSLPTAGEFGPRDFQSQYDLVGPGGVGLLVFGSGLDWGAAYLGPDALPPGADELVPPARRLAPETLAGLRSAPDFGPGPDDGLGLVDGPDFGDGPDPYGDQDLDDPDLDDQDLDDGLDLDDRGFDDHLAFDDEPDLVDEPVTEPLAPATLATRRQPVLTPAPRPTGPPMISPVRVPEREWGVKAHHPGNVGPEVPTDVKLVVGGLCVVVIAAAIMIGMLVHYALAAVVIGVVGFLVIAAFLWFARL